MTYVREIETALARARSGDVVNVGCRKHDVGVSYELKGVANEKTTLLDRLLELSHKHRTASGCTEKFAVEVYR